MSLEQSPVCRMKLLTASSFHRDALTKVGGREIKGFPMQPYSFKISAEQRMRWRQGFPMLACHWRMKWSYMPSLLDILVFATTTLSPL